MVKHNNVVPNGHFHKDWKLHVRTWFDQPAQHQRRRKVRNTKAARLAPRPVNRLQPAVHCPTQRYNMKVRLGRGFTRKEIKEAGLTIQYARSIGITVDTRRRNKSLEAVQINVERLKNYVSKLIVFPRGRNTKPKKGDSSVEDTSKATQFQGKILPIENDKTQKADLIPVTEEMKKNRAFVTVRKARNDAKLIGIRAKKAKEAAEKADKKKKE